MPGNRHEGAGGFPPVQTSPDTQPSETISPPRPAVAGPEQGASDKAAPPLRLVEPVSEPTPIFRRPTRKVTLEEVLEETSGYRISNVEYFAYLRAQEFNKWAELKRIQHDVSNGNSVNLRSTAYKVYLKLRNYHRLPSAPVVTALEKAAIAAVFSEESAEQPKGIWSKFKSLFSS